MPGLAPRSNSTVWQTVVVLSKDRTNFKVGCLYCQHRFLTGVTQLRKHFVDWKDSSGRNVNFKLCTGNTPRHVTSCAAARDFLLPHFLKNAVVSGEKFASN